MSAKRFGFVVEATISLGIEVEADTLDEAIAKAQCAPMRGLCHQCAASTRNEWSTSGELDCDPASSPLVDFFANGQQGGFDEAVEAWTEVSADDAAPPSTQRSAE